MAYIETRPDEVHVVLSMVSQPPLTGFIVHHSGHEDLLDRQPEECVCYRVRETLTSCLFYLELHMIYMLFSHYVHLHWRQWPQKFILQSACWSTSVVMWRITLSWYFVTLNSRGITIKYQDDTIADDRLKALLFLCAKKPSDDIDGAIGVG